MIRPFFGEKLEQASRVISLYQNHLRPTSALSGRGPVLTDLLESPVTASNMMPQVWERERSD
jgi:hypothetical protein